MSVTLQIVVDESESVRLDAFLARHLAGASRRAIRDLIAAGGARVNGRRARKGDLVHPQDRVTLAGLEPPAAPRLIAQPELPVRVLFEDEAVVAIDKPPGMPTHPLRSGERGTAANFLAGRYPELAQVGRPLEAGLVHRLDPGTSGVLLAARSDPAYRELRKMFRERRIEKVYLALVEGALDRQQRVTTPIAHRPRTARRMQVCPDRKHAHQLRARPAITSVRPRELYAQATLVEITITTGVRHQIRVHLASIGHPVVGDRLYGHGSALVADPERPLLHAARLGFRHPLTARRTAVEAALPPDFEAVVRQLPR